MLRVFLLVSVTIICHVLLLLAAPSNSKYGIVEAFSAPEPPNKSPTTASTNDVFRTFQFAPNGVCLQPRYFVCDQKKTKNQQKKDALSSPQTIKEASSLDYFTMRNVPGEGDCMFLAVALAAATSMGLGGNDVLLRAISRETRHVVAQILGDPTGTLYISETHGVVAARDLLQSATHQEGLNSTEEYLTQLRLEGRLGGLYGGGPELTVLANVLRRPISIYELEAIIKGDDDYNATVMSTSSGEDRSTSLLSTCKIVCKGTFGDGLFEDPCAKIPHSALMVEESSSSTTIPEGAYSWHLHILVVDVSPQEKHACVLLPSTTTTKKGDELESRGRPPESLLSS